MGAVTTRSVATDGPQGKEAPRAGELGAAADRWRRTLSCFVQSPLLQLLFLFLILVNILTGGAKSWEKVGQGLGRPSPNYMLPKTRI